MSYYSDYDYEDYGLKRHKLSDAIKWLIVFVLVLGLIGAVISLFVMLDRQTTVTEIGAEQYMVGGLDEEGAPMDTDTSIVTRTGFSAKGIKTEVAEGAAVTYELFFYDTGGEFISSTGDLSAAFNGNVPDNAVSAKCVITPAEDEDGKISLTEVFGYAGLVTITVDR